MHNLTIFLLAFEMTTLLLFQYCIAIPIAQNDIDSYGYSNIGGGGGSGGGGGNGKVDYNVVVGHLKDFFMYFPVIMTTLKESMSGFPKFAEGIRVLASKSGRLEPVDCKCNSRRNRNGDSNEIGTDSHYS